MPDNLEPQPSESHSPRGKRGRPRKAPPGQARPREPGWVKREHHVHSMRRTPGGQLIRRDATPEEIADIMRRGDEGRRKKRADTWFKW